MNILSKKTTSIIAMILLCAIGIWMIVEPYLKRDNASSESNNPESNRPDPAGIVQVMYNPEDADMDKSGHIDFKEETVLGIALSINNIGGGLSAGMIGINALTMGFLSAVVNFIPLLAGNYIAEFFVKCNLVRKAGFVGGFVLIGIGIGQIV